MGSVSLLGQEVAARRYASKPLYPIEPASLKVDQESQRSTTSLMITASKSVGKTASTSVR
jgi:hypothetical protein